MEPTFADYVRWPSPTPFREIRSRWVPEFIVDPRRELPHVMYAVLWSRLVTLELAFRVVELSPAGCRVELVTEAEPEAPKQVVTVDLLWEPARGEWVTSEFPKPVSKLAQAGLRSLLAPWNRKSSFFCSAQGGRLLGDGNPKDGTGFVSNAVQAAEPEPGFAEASSRSRSRSPRQSRARVVYADRSRRSPRRRR